jgi:uncharacterized protein (TIGR02996 family)
VPRFEHHDTVRRFWEIRLAGSTYTLRWGKVGSPGQLRTKQFSSDEQARHDYDRQIAAKRRSGYKQVYDGGEPEVMVQRASGGVAGARNPALEQAILDDPTDEGALLVLGDWLQSQGDPRGTLIALQHAQAREKDPTKFLALKRDAAAHYTTHEAALIGALDPWRHLFELDWNVGYIRGARLSSSAPRPGEPTMPDILAELVKLPSALALGDLAFGSIGEPRDPPGGRYQAVIEWLAAHAPQTLRSLHFGDYWAGTYPPADAGDAAALGSFAAAAPRLARLRRLTIAHGVLDLEDCALPELRTFDHRSALDDATLAWLGRASLAQLESLHLYGWYAPWSLAPLLAPRRFPQLRQLRLTGGRATTQLCELLAESPILRQLELVDLDGGDLADDDDVTRVIELAPAFRHLRAFHLGQQRLTYGAVKRMREHNLVIKVPKKYQ